MLTARERIERQMSDPALVRLHRKLSCLSSVLTVMNTGAHPDDEQNGMLAWLRFGLGMRVIIACSTRGEGGQNALGPERLGALGVVRSRELEESARVIDSDIAWLGHGPDDPVHDFGFSKDGDATFERWGKERIIERLVRAYRETRPDIVIPTFLDVPGQHGHHRAMTQAAEAAIALAADANVFPEHVHEGLAPWQVAKFYLPAWSGGGSTYDDEVPPPETTLTLRVEGRDLPTGAEFDRIGEWSRYFHASQGMGRWPKHAASRWPLHLKFAAAPRSEASIQDGLPTSLSALASSATELEQHADGPADEALRALRDKLASADRDITAAQQAFPHRDAILQHLTAAAGHLVWVAEQAPEPFQKAHAHRIARKRQEIDAAILDASGLFERAYCEPASIGPGGTAVLTVELSPSSTAVEITPILPAGVTAKQEQTGEECIFRLTASEDAAFSNLFQPGWSSLGGNGEAHLQLTAEVSGRIARACFDFEEPLLVAPRQSVTLTPETVIVPVTADARQWPIQAKIQGETAALSIEAPAGWAMEPKDGGWILRAETEPRQGLLRLEPKIDGRPAYRTLPIVYPHIGRSAYRESAALNILCLDLALPDGARIGYVGGGADHVGTWLSRMGLDVTEMDETALSGDLSRFTTIVIGIFAFGLRNDLAAARPRLHRFVEEGGHLVTLYHRPSDGWDPAQTPVRPLEIGSPSLRWRVTDPNAAVTILAPEHPLLTGPNRVNEEDWSGWNKERGLYFASRWDDAYVPLLSMHDAGEQPLTGALVSARIGKGRHTHTSLVLHHQMDRLVSGAFRIMANLVQPA